MMKSGAPPDKVRVLYRLLPTEFHGLNSRIDFLRLSLFGSWYYFNFFINVGQIYIINNKNVDLSGNPCQLSYGNYLC